MNDLVIFLRAQLEEDERGGGVEGDGHWECTSTGVLDLGGIEGFDGVVQGPRDAIYHMARHDPARVLAEVEAKRRILDVAVALAETQGDGPVGERLMKDASDLLLAHLCSAYAGQPGYREMWRP